MCNSKSYLYNSAFAIIQYFDLNTCKYLMDVEYFSIIYFWKKNEYGAMARRQFKITQCNTHTKICSMKQLFELSSLMVKISLEIWTQKYMP